MRTELLPASDPATRHARGTTWRQRAALVVAIACAVSAWACSGAQLAQAQSDTRALRDELDDLKRSQAAARVQFDEFRNRLVMIEEKIDTARVDSARVDGGRRADGSRDDGWIPRLPTVRVEPGPVPPIEGAQPGRTATEPVRSARRDGSPDILVPGTGADPEPANGPSGPADDPPPQQDTSAVPLRPNLDPAAALYTHAKALLDSGQLQPARTKFENLQRLYPDHELADNALYWIGESYYAQSLWLKAAQAFLRVCKEYPRANKVPDALLKLGRSYSQLGDDKGAHDVLRQLVRQFPTTPAGQLAAGELQKPRGEP